MKKNDFTLVGIIGSVLGVLFLLGAMFAAEFYEVHQGVYNTVVYPYAGYSISLLIVAAVLLVIGLAFLWRAGQEIVVPQIPPPTPQ